MRKYLLLILILSLALSDLIGQVVVPKPGALNQIPILVNDSLMFIGADVDSLTEEQRYFNPLYLIVHKGKEHLKKQLVVASVCDCDPTIPSKHIGIFSVSKDKYVSFSQGNLQYFPAANLWKFANTQYEYLGNSNKYLSSTYRNWIDLFGWSGNNITASFGISTSTKTNEYTGEFIDWGNNQICGDKPNTWRTLSKDEWEYLISRRNRASNLIGVACVNGINGLVILPDNWLTPQGIVFKSGFNAEYGESHFASHQQFTLEQWTILEDAGAVFLPTAGWREASTLSSTLRGGHYWSSSCRDDNNAHYLSFSSKEVWMNCNSLHRGFAVRLVSDIYIDCDTVVKTISFSTTDTILYTGDSMYLHSLISHCIEDEIQWSLSDTTLAQINNFSANGCNLIALQAGTLRLTATSTNDPNIVAECKIIVRDRYASGFFSIGGDKRIIFSPGNLQHLPATNQWKFAEAQYESIGNNNTYISSTYRNWVDLFGYSANNQTAPYGISISTMPADYAGEFIDWGSNSISGDKPNTWRTLTKDEWEYLLNKRTDAKRLRSHAQINGINGFIFLPDDWVCPENIEFVLEAKRYSQQVFTTEQWEILEQSGAIFLPAAGRREGEKLIDFNSHGNYWSSTRKDSSTVEYFAFIPDECYVDARRNITLGRPVRLVRDTVIPEYVDLGLGVKWATFNLGATAPEEAGYYFAWGETQEKDDYSWKTYTWIDGSTYDSPLTKYCTNTANGSVDNKAMLTPEDDAAAVYWKDQWRTPTQAEWKSLLDSCIWQWVSLNGVYGYRVTSKIKGYEDKSIFLPITGYRSGSTKTNAISGYYWASNIFTSDPGNAYRVYFHSTSKSVSHHLNRYSGYPIRPVYGEHVISLPSLTTIAATEITDDSALLGGKITTNGGAKITEFGIVYSKSKNPTTADNKIVSNGGIGLYFSTLDNLQNNTTYYARAYATNEKGTRYGGQVSFTTGMFNPVDTSGIENGHAYVDLGLSVKWATCNIGATTPEEYGDYFAWGETTTKEQYTTKNYKWYNSTNGPILKYNTDNSKGEIDNITKLEPEDDAATMNWGGSWRMPTYTEFSELLTECTYVWTTQNGVRGHKITSKKNGNSIFLPAAGYISGKTLYYSTSGYYLSSTLRTASPIYSLSYYVRSGYYSSTEFGRNYGTPIRPVWGEGKFGTPTVNTQVATQITENSALIGGRVTSDGGANIIEHGVVYSTSTNNLTITKGEKVISNDGLSSFICQLTGLSTETTYYARAYATNGAGKTGYGEQISFTTTSTAVSLPSGNDKGHGYVDLGLSVKWATCNIGATEPEEYGDFFAWGETTTKENFSWDTYTWWNVADSTITKYCVSSKYGEVDNKVFLEATDDAATILWQGTWRIPTAEEWTELQTKCSWYWVSKNNIDGYKVVGKNGNSIFLPTAGYQVNNQVKEQSVNGYYWSRTLYQILSSYAQGVSFNNKYINSYYNGRYCGQSIRPVYP